jgi:proteasome accessory factor B
VAIRFTELVSDYVREKKWHPSQKLRELRNGGVELHLTLSSLVEVQRWVLSWGGQASVISPAELRDHIATAALTLLENHADPAAPS